MSRLIATKKKLYVFIDLYKVPEKLIKNDRSICYISSSKFEMYLKKINKEDSIYLDSNVSYFYYNLLKNRKNKLTIGEDPCKIIKARKNSYEIKKSYIEDSDEDTDDEKIVDEDKEVKEENEDAEIVETKDLDDSSTYSETNNWWTFLWGH